MPFIVENGTGLSGANSLASVAQADAFSMLHPEGEDWLMLDPEPKQAWLVLATSLVEAAVDWPGRRLNPFQPLAFPRALLMDRDGFVHPVAPIPNAVVEAVCETARTLAARHAAGQSTTTTGTASAQAVQEVKVGPIELVMASPASSGGTAAVAAAPALVPPTALLKLRRFGHPRTGYGPRTMIRWD